MTLLAAQDVHVDLGGTAILRGCTLRAGGGELVAIVGPNGAGKTTLLRAAAGLQRSASGVVCWDGRDVRHIRPRALARVRAYVPQRPRVADNVRVRDAVTLGRAPHLGPLRGTTGHDDQAIERAMRRTGIAAFAGRRLDTLSGGELQRVSVAVALAQETPALLLDEPTSSLDLGATATFARLVRGLADDGLCIVLVLHDLALAAAIADRVVVVDAGRTVADGLADEVLHRNRLAETWRIDAHLEDGALRVGWLSHRKELVR